MDTQAYSGLLDYIDTLELPEAIVYYLSSSLRACRVNDTETMGKKAQLCAEIAIQQKHTSALASAWVHAAVAHALNGDRNGALNLFERARTFFLLNRDGRQRRGEGIATFGIGLLFEENSHVKLSHIQTLGPRQAQHNQESLRLLARVLDHYATVYDQNQHAYLTMIKNQILNARRPTITPQWCGEVSSNFRNSNLQAPVRRLLAQSIQACETEDYQQMLRRAHEALRVASACQDALGAAASQVHLVLAHSLLEDHAAAIQACDRAQRIYARYDDWDQLRCRAITGYLAGTICAHSIRLLEQQRRVALTKATKTYRYAIKILQPATVQTPTIIGLCSTIEKRIIGLRLP